MTKNTNGRPASRKPRPTLTQEQRDARVKEAHDMIAEEVKNLRDSSEWKRYLDMAAKFYTYSWNNVLLIHIQCAMRGMSTPTRCAGFNKWKEFNRNVRKGEKGLTIFRPIIVKIKPGELGYVEGENRTKCVGFATTATFDVQQTEGEPLPTRPEIQWPSGSAPAGMFDALKRYAQSIGFSVCFGDSGAAEGYMDPTAKEIVIAQKHIGNDAMLVMTLAHEIGHAALHAEGDFNYRAHRGIAETEAESVAYIVCRHFGVDVGECAFNYIAGWTPSVEDITNTGRRVMGVSSKVIDAIAPDVADYVPEVQQTLF
jgi:antirestriction protein ArdC